MHLLEIAASWAWKTSLASLFLAVPALLAAAFLRKAAFTSLRYVLGLMVVARLLMPMVVPSPLSVFNLFRPSGEPVSSPTKIDGAVESTAGQAMVQPRNHFPVTINPFVAADRTIPILPLVWAIGAIAILTRVLWQHCRVQRWMAAGEKIGRSGRARAVRSARTDSSRREESYHLELLSVATDALATMNSRKSIDIYFVPKLRTPALFGLFRPAVLLPKELVESGDLTRLRLVFLHEIAHVRRRDVCVNWLGIFARALHWFNPLVWLALRRLRVDQELLCDRDVMRALNPEEHHGYGETLLALASPRDFEFSTLIPVSSNFKQLKERIAMIKQFKPVTSRWLIFVVPPLSAMLAVATFTAAGKTPTKPPETKTEISAANKANINRRIDSLEKQLAIANDRVKAFEDTLERLRRDLGFSAETKEDLAKQFEAKYRVETERTHTELEYVQQKVMFESMRGMDHQALIQTLPTAHPDAALDALLQNLQNSERELAGLRVDKGPDHAEVKRVEAMVKLVEKQIDQRINGILTGMEKLVAAHKAVLDSLAEKAAEQRARENDLLSRSSDFFLVKRNLEIEQQVRDELYVRLLQEKSERQISQQ